MTPISASVNGSCPMKALSPGSAFQGGMKRFLVTLAIWVARILTSP
jgi:hypothetical protein